MMTPEDLQEKAQGPELVLSCSVSPQDTLYQLMKYNGAFFHQILAGDSTRLLTLPTSRIQLFVYFQSLKYFGRMTDNGLRH